MASPSELNFLIKIRDAASSTIKALEGNIEGAAKAFTTWGAQAKQATADVNASADAARAASQAFADAANKSKAYISPAEAQKHGVYRSGGLGQDAQYKVLAQTAEQQKTVTDLVNKGSEAVKGHGEAHKEAKGKIEEHLTGLQAFKAGMGELTETALKAGEAIVAMWAGTEAVRGAIETSERVKVSMQNISYYSGAAAEKVKGFREEIVAMAPAMMKASTADIEKMFIQSIRLGGTATQTMKDWSETMDKLSKGSAEGPVQLGEAMQKLLEQTHEGPDAVKKYGDALALLEKNSSQSSTSILEWSSNLVESTGDLHMSTLELMAWGSVAKEVGIMPLKMGGAMNAAVQQMKRASAIGGAAMDDLAHAMGRSIKDIEKLAQDPSKAINALLDAIVKMKAEGRNVQPFLESIGLGGMTKQLVAMSESNTRRSRLDLVHDESIGTGEAAEAKAKKDDTPFDAAFTKMTAAWDRFKKAMGDDFSKTFTQAIERLADVLKGLAWLLEKTSGSVGDFLGKLILAGIYLTTTHLLVQSVIKALGLMGFSFGASAAAAVEGAAVTEGAMAATGAAAAGATSKVMGLARAFGAAGLAYAAMPMAKDLGDWLGDKINKHLPRAAAAIAEWRDNGNALGHGIKVANEWLSGDKGEEEKKKEAEKKAKEGHGGEHGKAAEGEHAKTETPEETAKKVSDNDDRLNARVASLEKLRGATEKVRDLERALIELRARNDTLPERFKRTQEEIASATQLLEIEQRKADPVRQYVYETQKAGAAAGDITKAMQEERQIENDLIKLKESGVALDEKDYAIRRRLIEQTARAKQDVDRAVTVQKQTQTIKDQIAQATALTKTDKDRVAVKQQLDQLERDAHINPTQRAELEKLLTLHKDILRTIEQEDKLNTTGKAKRDYADDMKLLKERKDLTEAQRAREMTALQQGTLGARDPIGKDIQSAKDQLASLKLGGEYREADVKTTERLLELGRQGVKVTQEQAAALAETNRVLQDTQKAQSSGLTGWVNQVGSLRNNLNDTAKNFADGLSGAIGNALDRKKDAFRSFLADFGRQLRQMAIKQLMAQLFTDGTGDGNKGLAGMLQKLFVSSGDQKKGIGGLISGLVNGKEGDDKGKGIDVAGANEAAKNALETANMTVNAAVVHLNGIGGNNALTNAIPGGEAGKTMFPSADKTLAADKSLFGALAPVKSDSIRPGGSFDLNGGVGTAAGTIGKNSIAAFGQGLTTLPTSDAVAAGVKAVMPAFGGPGFNVRGVKNLNPGNIMWDGPKGFAARMGATGSAGLDQGHGVAVFPDIATGNKALETLALRKYNQGMTTADKLIATPRTGWTPGNHGAAANVAKSMGIGPHDDLNLRDPAMMKLFREKLGEQENGPAGQRYIKALTEGGKAVRAKEKTEETPAKKPADQWEGRKKFDYENGGKEIDTTPTSSIKGARDFKALASEGDFNRKLVDTFGAKPLPTQDELLAMSKTVKTSEMVQKDMPPRWKGDLASVRHNNSGSQFPNELAGKYGSKEWSLLKDGTNQKNKIAKFDTPEQGAAAHFDLLANGKNFKDKPVEDVVKSWSGKNNWQTYLKEVTGAAGIKPGEKPFNMDSMAQPDFAKSVVKTMSEHEAGKGKGLDDFTLDRAHKLFLQKNKLDVDRKDLMPLKPRASNDNLDMSPTGSIRQQVAQAKKQMEVVGKDMKQVMKPIEDGMTKEFKDVGSKIKESANFEGLDQSLQGVGQQAQSSVGDLGGFGSSITGLIGPLTQGTQGAGQFATSVMSLAQKLLSGLGGGGGGGMLGGLGSAVGGLFHDGGVVGSGGGLRLVSSDTWAHAPRFHVGGGKGVDSAKGEYGAVLQRGERVLTQAQDRATAAAINGLADHAMAGQKGGDVHNNRSMQFNFNAKFASGDGFRRNQGQIASEMHKQAARMFARNA